MSREREPVFSDDNPEWTEGDFARALPASALPPAIRDQFANGRRTRGPQKRPVKVPISIRLAADIVAHFKVGGPGWHGRIEEALRQAAGLDPSPSDGAAPPHGRS